MEFSINSGVPQTGRNGCRVVGVFEPRKLSGAAAGIDRAAKGYLASVVRRGDMQGQLGATLLLHNVPGIAAERVLLVGLGSQVAFREKQYREAVAAAVRALNVTGSEEATLHLTELAVDRRDAAWNVAQAVMVAREGGYRFTRMKSRSEAAEPALRRIVLSVDRAAGKRAAAANYRDLSFVRDVLSPTRCILLSGRYSRSLFSRTYGLES